MRDPERIPRMLKLLRHAWLKAPDQRLGQLIENCSHSTAPGVFHVEDDVTEQGLRNWIEAHEPPSECRVCRNGSFLRLLPPGPERKCSACGRTS